MRVSQCVPINLPIASINLPEWLFTMTEDDYAKCSRGPRAIGMLGGPQRSGMVNVESIGGSLLIQHYATSRAEAHHVTMTSERSRAYMMHLVPVPCRVVWDIQVRADGSMKSLFTCAIDVRLPTPVRLMSYATAAPLFIRRHLDEETHGFAQAIERQFQRQERDAA